MANAEQLAILKQGVEVWNKWRKENFWEFFLKIKIDLTDVDLSKLKINDFDLSSADLSNTKLVETHLNRANLYYAKFINTDLTFAQLMHAYLQNSNFFTANLRGANFFSANLFHSNLKNVNLNYTNFNNANLTAVDFSNSILNYTKLNNANISSSVFNTTSLANLSLDNVIGLESAIHDGPSFLDISVFQQTKTPLPKQFTRGCGWQDWMVKSMELQNPALLPDQVVDVLYEVERLRNGSPLQMHNLFISHSRKDAAFIEFIGKQLEQRNILYWLDVRDATAGPLEKQIDKAIRLNQTFLLVLSQHSCESDWVEWELDKARQLEKELGRHVICPIQLDHSWENGNLSERIKLQIKKYNVLDFSQWQDSSTFAKQFERLIKGLDLFYKPA